MSIFLKDKIIIFTRYPQPGTTKTRLIPLIGKDGAVLIHRKMALKTVSTCQRYSSSSRVTIEIHYEGCEEQLMKQWLGNSFPYKKQAGGNLGNRMTHAFNDAFQKGSQRVIIIGTDCPELMTDHLKAAFDSLNDNLLVFGPAFDGGYYLIGLRNDAYNIAIPKLFRNIEWGSSTVLDTTVKNVRFLDISFNLLPFLHDVDRPEDISFWERTQKRLSVVIPMLNEAENIDTTLSRIKNGTNVEIITVDGGSTDGTVEKARAHGVNVYNSSKSRAAQMNQGFLQTTGEIVVFLHADTLLPVDYDVLVRTTLEDPHIICGAFSLEINSHHKGLRIIENMTYFRAKYLQMPYGDQALFMRSHTFRESGGFPEIPLMEDFELVRRLKRMGKIKIVQVPAITSGRRWEEVGIWRTTVINQIVIILYYLGVSPNTLYKMYHCV